MFFYIGKHKRRKARDKWAIMTYGLIGISFSFYSVIVIAIILEAGR